MMLLRLLALFIIVPVIELLVIIEVGARIGAVTTVLLVVATGTVGAWLTRQQGFTVLRRLQYETNGGQPPGDVLIDGVMVLLGGMTLLTPGFITDAVGLSFLIPGTRALWRRLIIDRIRLYMETGKIIVYRSR